MNPDDDLSIHAVINGSLGMTPGKIAAQTFQACQRLYARARDDHDLTERLLAWEEKRTKTVIYIAKNDHIFSRCVNEAGSGVVMVDEGINEIPADSSTIWASWPLGRSEYPQILRHKGIKIWRAPAEPI